MVERNRSENFSEKTFMREVTQKQLNQMKNNGGLKKFEISIKTKYKEREKTIRKKESNRKWQQDIKSDKKHVKKETLFYKNM